MRPLGAVRKDGTGWMIVDLRVSTGAVLAELDYSEASMREFLIEIRQLDGVVSAEVDVPSANAVRPLQEAIPGCTAGRDAAPAEIDWAPRLVGLFDLDAPRPAGSGIRIGHVDSGYTDHPELDAASNYDLVNTTSTVDGTGGLDPMPGGTSHGTATGTIMASEPGTSATDDTGQPTDGITGLAPEATVIAARALDSVVIAEAPFFSQSVIAEAIHHCIAVGCHVVSMSFGGVVSEAVADALRDAHEADIILCAAAGNCVGFVVQPASFAEVIGCGGVGIDPDGSVHPWPGTSEGPAVDISAPSENVWVGDFIDGDAVVRPGEGTSFAAPHVAAAAAIWLEHHGHAALIDHYQETGARLGDVYREAVRRSARTPAGWDTANNGAGVLNLPQLLAEPLPTPPFSTDSSVPSLPDLGVLVGTIIGGTVSVLPGLDLIPDLASPITAVVDLDHLTVRDDGEFWGGAEPYLLATYLVVDGTTAEIEIEVDVGDLEGEGVVLTATMAPLVGRDSIVEVERRGDQGNLGNVNIGPLELNADGPLVVDIPSADGLFTRELIPIPIRFLIDGGDIVAGVDVIGLPGFIGVHAMLSEEDFTPPHAIAAAHDAVAEGIASILEDVLETIELSDLSVDPDAFVERTAEIEDAAAAAAADAMNLWEIFWGGIVDPDDQLIQTFSFVNALQLGSPVPISPPRYQDVHGDWILVGEIRESATT